LQLLGGIWILQTFPAIVIGLYTRWFHRGALILGWAAGMAYGTVEAYRAHGGGQAHFGASTAPVFGHTTYIAMTALILNLAISAVLTVVFRRIGLQDGYDETRPEDYIADPAPGPVTAPRPAAPRPTAPRPTAPRPTAPRPVATPSAPSRSSPPSPGWAAANGAGQQPLSSRGVVEEDPEGVART
jgi:hypothetical protein